MTRVEAAPMPWMKRSASSTSKVGAKTAPIAARMYTTRPNEQRAAPSETVGRRSVGEQGESHAAEIGRDDELAMVLVGDVEALADLLETGQHDIDRQRVERHQAGARAR